MTHIQPFRLASGGRIDRGKPVSFRFDGRPYSGYDGDTLASALLANGVRVAGRSFRFHRPRGVFAAGIEEPNVVVQLGQGALAEPNLKATEVLLHEGLEARAVNAWPSARFDIAALSDLVSPLLGAGFYYKSFMWPGWSWFSGAIRRMGGLGRSPQQADPARYEQRHEHCDVLVIGSGPAGLAAALAAADAGARVILAERDHEFGGAILAEPGEIEGKAAGNWAADTIAHLRTRENVALISCCTAFGYYDHNTVGMLEIDSGQQRLWTVRARHVVLATGAYERPIVFRNNDRPNILLTSAARTYLHRFAVAPGKRVVIATNNDSAYDLALDLKARGIEVAAFADARSAPPPEGGAAIKAAGIRLLAGWVPCNTQGRGGIRAVELKRTNADATDTMRIACDTLCVSGGWNPVVHLFSQSGGQLRYDTALQSFVPAKSAQEVTVVGSANGAISLAGALREGSLAGRRAAERLGFKNSDPVVQPVEEPVVTPPKTLWQVESPDAGRAWVDLLNDVTSADIRQAADENYRSVEHLKRYTTLGMAVDQGKTSNINAIGALSEILGKPIADIGTTKFRPPFHPVRFGALTAGSTGRFLHPLKQLPARDAHLRLGAVMEDYGGWQRPAYYPYTNEAEETAVRRETLSVRNNVGLYDASPLGKIRLAGRDAAEFADRVYLNAMKSLKPGRCRYGLMLHENGIVYDDGVLMRVAEDEFLVGTTSGHAGSVALSLEEWLQCEWTDLEVAVEDVTAEWATITIAGPNAFLLLRKLEIAGMDENLPHMALADGRIGGVPCRVARVSFTGERSYEVSVPAAHGEALWQAAIDKGAPFGVVPVGLEALMRLRLEKGYLHIGTDTDSATTYPQDLGYARAIAGKAGDFIGRRSTILPEALREGRRQFVGIEPVAPGQEIFVGSHAIATDGRSEGWVTSAGYSPALGRHVALAMIENGRVRHGEEIALLHLGRRSRARICNPCSYDAEGGRLHG